MTYVDFCNVNDRKTQVGQNDLVWTDIVTGTQYYIAKNTYMQEFNKIIESIKKYKNADDIYNFLNKEDELIFNFPYLTPFESTDKSIRPPCLKDVATLCVGLAYCLSNGDKGVRLEAYRHFFGIESSKRQEVITAAILIGELCRGISSNDKGDLYVDIVKGGVYKTKKYIMENNDIKCLRGSSYLLDNINRIRMPAYFAQNYIPECIIYCGGGNIFAMLPAGQGEKVAEDIESIYKEVTVTAQSAVISYRVNVTDLLFNYRDTMKEVEEALEDRKKLKVYLDVDPHGGDINRYARAEDEIKLKFSRLLGQGERVVCDLCKIRDAHYIFNDAEGEVYSCESCLHKYSAGIEAKDILTDEFKAFGTKEKGLDELSAFDDRKYIAIIYGDGNNFGQLVKNITNVYEMMYFSRKTEYAAIKSVKEALKYVYGLKGKKIPLEILALGGDDIFIIVPACVSLPMSVKLIEVFDGQFRNLSKDEKNVTMSVGVIISKYNTPVRNLFELSQSLLKRAKKLGRNLSEGTVDFAVLESNSYIDDTVHTAYGEIKQKMCPFKCSELRDLIELVRNMKKNKAAKSHIYKYRDASMSMLPLEFMLFYMYDKSRNHYIQDVEKRLNSLFKRVGISFNNGLFVVSGDEKDKREYYSPWYDITEIWDYVD